MADPRYNNARNERGPKGISTGGVPAQNFGVEAGLSPLGVSADDELMKQQSKAEQVKFGRDSSYGVSSNLINALDVTQGITQSLNSVNRSMDVHDQNKQTRLNDDLVEVQAKAKEEGWDNNTLYEAERKVTNGYKDGWWTTQGRAKLTAMETGMEIKNDGFNLEIGLADVADMERDMIARGDSYENTFNAVDKQFNNIIAANPGNDRVRVRIEAARDAAMARSSADRNKQLGIAFDKVNAAGGFEQLILNMPTDMGQESFIAAGMDTLIEQGGEAMQLMMQNEYNEESNTFEGPNSGILRKMLEAKMLPMYNQAVAATKANNRAKDKTRQVAIATSIPTPSNTNLAISIDPKEEMEGLAIMKEGFLNYDALMTGNGQPTSANFQEILGLVGQTTSKMITNAGGVQHQAQVLKAMGRLMEDEDIATQFAASSGIDINDNEAMDQFKGDLKNAVLGSLKAEKTKTNTAGAEFAKQNNTKATDQQPGIYHTLAQTVTSGEPAMIPTLENITDPALRGPVVQAFTTTVSEMLTYGNIEGILDNTQFAEVSNKVREAMVNEDMDKAIAVLEEAGIANVKNSPFNFVRKNGKFEIGPTGDGPTKDEMWKVQMVTVAHELPRDKDGRFNIEGDASRLNIIKSLEEYIMTDIEDLNPSELTAKLLGVGTRLTTTLKGGQGVFNTLVNKVFTDARGQDLPQVLQELLPDALTRASSKMSKGTFTPEDSAKLDTMIRATTAGANMQMTKAITDEFVKKEQVMMAAGRAFLVNATGDNLNSNFATNLWSWLDPGMTGDDEGIALFAGEVMSSTVNRNIVAVAFAKMAEDGVAGLSEVDVATGEFDILVKGSDLDAMGDTLNEYISEMGFKRSYQKDSDGNIVGMQYVKKDTYTTYEKGKYVEQSGYDLDTSTVDGVFEDGYTQSVVQRGLKSTFGLTHEQASELTSNPEWNASAGTWFRPFKETIQESGQIEDLANRIQAQTEANGVKRSPELEALYQSLRSGTLGGPMAEYMGRAKESRKDRGMENPSDISMWDIYAEIAADLYDVDSWDVRPVDMVPEQYSPIMGERNMGDIQQANVKFSMSSALKRMSDMIDGQGEFPLFGPSTLITKTKATGKSYRKEIKESPTSVVTPRFYQ